MKERPILFSTEMVQAILEGRKTQTRRILKPQLPYHKFDFCGDNEGAYSALTSKGYLEFRGYKIDGNGNREYAPFCIKPKHGEKNDILWVRETWALYNLGGYKYIYKADNVDYANPKWKPSIHMPKEACRIKLKIKSILIEQLLDISEQDAIAEGIEGSFTEYGYRYRNYLKENDLVVSPKESYFSLWDKINGNDSHKQNAYVWVIEFERA